MIASRTPAPLVSCIIPAHDEERLIGRTLSALRAGLGELGEPSEVIVVDDDSGDATAAVAAAAGATVIPVRHRQIARTRNAGARIARGQVFVFVDADTTVPAPVLKATMAAIRDGAAGGGASVEFEGRLPGYARLLLPLMRSVMRWGRLAAGCYLFCTREAFTATGGFDERLFGGEELAFSRDGVGESSSCERRSSPQVASCAPIRVGKWYA